MRSLHGNWISLSLIFVLQGCGGGGGTGSAAAPPAASPMATATMLNAVNAAAQAVCPAGGATITSGLDTNGNGILDAAEVTSSQNVCNGVAGPAATTLVRTSAEPAGARCPNGGYEISVGRDLDGNTTLDTTEVESSAYVCQSAAGGPAPTSSLIAIVAEPAGANCTYAGSRIDAGLDSNANSALDAGEITSTRYICNGAPGPGVVWNEITGTAVQALPGNGYLANNAAQVVVTLPAAPPVGSIVRVSGVGAGGWRLAQNAGQSVLLQGLSNTLPAGATWTARESSALWSAIASSADGSRLLAAPKFAALKLSTDGGQSWTPVDTARNWIAVASSADGSVLLGATEVGRLYVSNDAGQTWGQRGNSQLWRSVAMSADGSKMVAVGPNYAIYTSSDSGLTWNPQDVARFWWAVASSADGNKLTAAVRGGVIYTSSDSGLTWAASGSGSRDWYSVASSADGTKLVATVTNGQIYTSTDSGASWTARDTNRDWRAVTSSADGVRLLAATSGGTLYTSADSGSTWTARESNRFWTGVASSADGTRLAATADASPVYTSTSQDRTTVGPAGFVSGAQYDALELMYTGDGLFTPLSYYLRSSQFQAN